jgi:glutamyl-Q tRNA(Asp) synthetase
MPHDPKPQTTRFAPSPTGYLHLGHALSAFDAAEAAAGGRFLLRIEDIDTTRCRPEFTAAIEEDLSWLGLEWELPVRRQSEHFAAYRAALDRLRAMDLLYPCVLSRKELAAVTTRTASDGAACVTDTDRVLDPETYRERVASGAPTALRLRMARAIGIAAERGEPLVWSDTRHGSRTANPAAHGDVILARKETPTSYHLSVVVDDALQGITLVTRGMDLFEATDIHRLLQALLALPVPHYRHHDLILGPDGKRLAKSHGSIAIRDLRAQGLTPMDIRKKVGF